MYDEWVVLFLLLLWLKIYIKEPKIKWQNSIGSLNECQWNNNVVDFQFLREYFHFDCDKLNENRPINNCYCFFSIKSKLLGNFFSISTLVGGFFQGRNWLNDDYDDDDDDITVIWQRWKCQLIRFLQLTKWSENGRR